MAGYARQSVADIVANEVIKAAPINAEFNALRDAFLVASGHKHDGSATEGAYVSLIADTDGYNKVVIDSTNNRVQFFVEVSSAAVEQMRLQDGALVPVTDNDIDLGTSAVEFKDLYLDGTAKIDTLTVDENATIAGTLGVTGNVTLGNSSSNTVTIPADVASNLIPSADSTYTIGDASNYWSHGYIDAITTTGNVSIGGTLTVTSVIDMTNDKITNLATPTNSTDAATKGYVDTTVSNLVDSAPGTLDTLNELAAALGDDPNFATTVANSIATKLSLSGGTMTGDIAMGSNKITGLGTPTSGNDATNKTYVDGILGSATSAAASAAAAAASATSAANSYDSFDDRYLGAKAVEPSVDNDGDPLITGALYFNTATNTMRVYDGVAWKNAGSAVNGTAERFVYTATASQTTFSANYDVGFVDVYLNGVKLLAGTDFTATSGTNIVLSTGAALNDTIDIVGYGAFNVANTYTQATADGKFLQVTNDLSDLNDAPTALQNLGLTATAAELNILDGATLSTAELNILDGVTASTAELNILDGVTASTTELNYVDGVTSAIQTQLNAKASISGSETLTSKTLTDPVIIGAITEDIYTISDGAAFEIDPSNGSIQLITLGAARTPKATNFAAGESVTLLVDDGTAYTLTWTDATFGGSGVVWKTDGGVAPTLNTSGYTVIVLFKVSTQVYGARVGNA